MTYNLASPIHVLYSCLDAFSFARKVKLNTHGKTAEVNATVVPPIKFKIGPKEGTVKAANTIVINSTDLTAILCKQNSKSIKLSLLLFFQITMRNIQIMF